MKILGIETSCDETSAAVVENGRKILSNVVFSQEKMHQPFKGIVPEIASRAHVEQINAIVQKALIEAERHGKSGRGGKGGKSESLKTLTTSTTSTTFTTPLLDGIAVTVGPGLVGSLLVGKMTAEALGWMWNVPVIGVNHLEAHLYAPMLNHPKLSPPYLGLIVSGGHTDLILVKDFGKYETLGRTRDDAAGEAFDKVASLLNVGYPGGPAIDRLAKQGDSKAIPFTRPYLRGSWDFSFSGLKTAVLYFCQKNLPKILVYSSPAPSPANPAKAGSWRALPRPPVPLLAGSRAGGYSQLSTLNSQLIPDICASFQSAVVEVLVEKSILAAKKFRMKKIVVGGGVSANSLLRKMLTQAGRENGIRVYFPLPELSTDNAAMIAAVGYYNLRYGLWALSRELRTKREFYETHSPEHIAQSKSLLVDPSLPIQNW